MTARPATADDDGRHDDPAPAGQGTPTLADLLEALPGLYSEASAAAYRSKVKRAATILGARPERVTADPHALRARLERAPWQGHVRGATEAARKRRIDDLVARVTGACEKLRAARRAAADPAGTAAARAAWDALEAYVATRQVPPGAAAGGEAFAFGAAMAVANLRRLLMPCAPAELDGAAVAATAERLRPRDRARLRRSLRLLDRLIQQQNRHPEIAALLPPAPPGRVPPVRAGTTDWARYPAGLRADVEAALAAVIRDTGTVREDALAALGGGLDPAEVLERARATKRIRKPEASRRTYGTALRWLVREAGAAGILAPADMTGLPAVLRYETVQAVAEAWKRKADASPHLRNAGETSTLHGYLARLEVVARRALDDPRTATMIAVLRVSDDEISNPHVRGMSRERLEFLMYLAATPEAVEGLVGAPRALARAARAALAGWDGSSRAGRMRALRLYLAAVQAALQLARPLRPGNLRRLTIDGKDRHIRAPRTARGTATVCLRPDEVKNRQHLEHALPPDAWAIVREWIEVWRPRWIATMGVPDNARLVPGASADGALSAQTTAGIWTLGAATIGLPQMTGHMARHACATLYLAAHPGDYATVASLLGDKEDTVRAFYGHETGRAASQRFREVLERAHPGVFAGPAR